MHVVISARGAVDWINRWESDLLARYLPHTFKHPDTGKIETGALQLGVRPIRLYDITFPEGEYDRVMSMIFPTNKEKPGALQLMLRKILGVKKAKPWKLDKKNVVFKRNVTVDVIGIKEDKHDKEGIELI